MTDEEAQKLVRKHWKNQCQKLEDAGYSMSDTTPSPTKLDRLLLTQQYMIDEEAGRDFLRDLVLARYSDSVRSAIETRNQIEANVFEARDARLNVLQWEARKTYAHNYETVESMAQGSLLDEIPLHRWMGVSRAFPSDNRLSQDEEESVRTGTLPDKIGTTPSAKTLWQMAGAIGVHPILFLVDERVIDAVRRLVKSNKKQKAAEKAAEHTIEEVIEARKWFDAAETNERRRDAKMRWRSLPVNYAKKIECDSPGGKLGARLGIESEDPPTLATMTRFGHLLGKVSPEWLVSIDPFKEPGSELAIFDQDDQRSHGG